MHLFNCRCDKSRDILYSAALFTWVFLMQLALFSPKVEGAETIYWFEGQDKLAHALMFGTLYFLSAKVVVNNNLGWNSKKCLVLIIAYAIFTEFQQSFLPYRSFEVGDIVANIIGVLIAHYFFIRRL